MVFFQRFSVIDCEQHVLPVQHYSCPQNVIPHDTFKSPQRRVVEHTLRWPDTTWRRPLIRQWRSRLYDSLPAAIITALRATSKVEQSLHVARHDSSSHRHLRVCTQYAHCFSPVYKQANRQLGIIYLYSPKTVAIIQL